MNRLRPEDLNLSALPKTALGHLKTEAVAELLQRAAWDYREVLAQNQRLTSTVEELSRELEELRAQAASLQELVERRKDPDELARTLLTFAQRAAREERESARREGELALKKAARRAAKLEDDVAQRHADRLSEIARLEALRDEISVRLRGTLETLANRHGNDAGASESDEEPVAARKL
jgi:cell division septum initiation protein DivIVA